jgi:hypothetical protein
MSLVADALQALSVGQLTYLKGPITALTLTDLITSARHAIYDLDFNNEERSILFGFRDSNSIATVLASDCHRLACAAFQTIEGVPNEMREKPSMPWSVVKLYYAAFYAGHSMLRTCGESCSYFYREHTKRINDLRMAMNRTPSFGIDQGLYHCAADSALVNLKCGRVGAMVGGGHEAFWHIFGLWNRRAQDALPKSGLPSADTREVLVRLDWLNKILRENGGRNFDWLSHVRNDLQYRHKFGMWRPSTMRKAECGRLSRIAAQWRRDPMEIDLHEIAEDDPLSSFVACCAFVVAVCREMLEKIGSRLGRKSFVYFGALEAKSASTN